jgi:peptide/nickel transport system ATP-binding protein
MTATPLLQVSDLEVSFGQRRATRALDRVSLAVAPGETMAIVGESGSGKTTLCRAILGLVQPAGGSVTYAGRDITHLPFRQRRELGLQISVVFQNPYSSLNPSLRIGDIVAEPLLVRRKRSRDAAMSAAADMLGRVGLPADAVHRYPRHFSGGQLQRIAIARALIVEPRLVILDEALSALDLSAQAQVVNLLLDLRTQLDLTYLFVAHDLDIVRHFAHHAAVLYRGQLMEIGAAEQVCDQPRHPYTAHLVASAPVPDPARQRSRRAAVAAAGPRPPATGPVTATGCAFAPRCRHATALCHDQVPALRQASDGGMVACHHYPEVAAAVPATQPTS